MSGQTSNAPRYREVDVASLHAPCCDLYEASPAAAPAPPPWATPASWPTEPESFYVGPVRRWTLSDAIVHGPYGIVTVGDAVIRESLVHIPFHLPGYARADAQVELPPSATLGQLESALHAMSGGAENYYHWMLDILTRIQAPLPADDVPLLLPPVRRRFQQSAMDVLDDHGFGYLHLAEGQSLRVRSLLFMENMTGGGFAPHPALSAFFGRLLPGQAQSPAATRKIYITRKGEPSRPLLNEDDVIEVVREFDYTVCDMSLLPWQDQAVTFRSATHIVAPHGAGLANLVFCEPGAVLRELLADGYLNPCFRRLAAACGVAYDQLVGAAEPASGPVGHESMRWTIDVAELRMRLAAEKAAAP